MIAQDASDGILYYLVAGPGGGGRGAQHALQFVVSLQSLRERWAGPVHGVAGDVGACEIFGHIAQCDDRFSFTVDAKPPDAKCYGQKAKADIWADKFNRTIYLDCDTIVVGDFNALWPQEREVVFTGFSNWTSTGRRIAGRCNSWRRDFPREVALAGKFTIPAINTGVFAFGRYSQWFFHVWRRWCETQPRLFIGDETAAQVLAALAMMRDTETFPGIGHISSAVRFVDDRYNLSTKLGQHTEDPRIWHGHGNKFVTTESGRTLFLPRLRHCFDQNTYGICDWGEKYLPRVVGISGARNIDDLFQGATDE